MIRHTVIFRLKHAAGPAVAREFFNASAVPARLPTVENFDILRQASAKIEFTHGFSMEFEDQAAYDSYNAHPQHIGYVQNVWLQNIAEFMEIDYVPFAGSVAKTA
jgi:Stress responsive A/B Barrel Domain